MQNKPSQKPVENNPQEPYCLALLVSVVQVAQTLSVSERTVWRLVASGELKQPIRVGRCCRWLRSDVDAYIDLLTHRRR